MTKSRDNADNWAGDISGVTAGTGLTGGGTSGAVTLNVDTTTIQTRVAGVSDTEIGYLDGVTSAIQTQLDSKAPTASPTFTGTVTLPSTTSVGNVSATELGYLDGVTSAIQTQLDSKAPTSTPTFTGNVTANNSKAIVVNTTSVGSGGDWGNSIIEAQGTSGAANNPAMAWHAPGVSAMTVFHPRNTQALQIAGNSNVVDTGQKSIRNIFVSTSAPSGGIDGDVWIQYT